MAPLKKSFVDQLKSPVTLTFPPRRIVSLVPSQTELLADLGLEREVVGITKYCIHPTSWAASKHIVGGTKNFQIDKIEQLDPDLIIGNKEENYEEGIEQLSRRYPVWISDISTLEDALSMIRSIGEITDKIERSETIARAITDVFSGLRKFPNFSVLYLIWRKPWMAAGKMTFINSMLEKLGFRNTAASPRYPQLTSAEIQTLKPDCIFLSSEPYPFQKKHVAELRELCPSSRIFLVDGEMFSWYGSRLIKAPKYFNRLDLSE